jgi:hypothetical protein
LAGGFVLTKRIGNGGAVLVSVGFCGAALTGGICREGAKSAKEDAKKNLKSCRILCVLLHGAGGVLTVRFGSMYLTQPNFGTPQNSPFCLFLSEYVHLSLGNLPHHALSLSG